MPVSCGMGLAHFFKNTVANDLCLFRYRLHKIGIGPRHNSSRFTPAVFSGRLFCPVFPGQIGRMIHACTLWIDIENDWTAARNVFRLAWWASFLKAMQLGERIVISTPSALTRLDALDTVNRSMPEQFVTATEAAEFLRCSPITVKRLAREGKIPGHALTNGLRKRWRFLLSELAFAMQSEVSWTPSSAPLKQGGSGK